MHEQIQDLVRFYSHKFHVPIIDLTDSWQVECWDRNGLAVAWRGNSSTTKTIADMIVIHDPAFAKQLPGDLIVCDDVPVARIGKQWLVLLIWPKNPPAMSLVRKLIDQHLPRLCRAYRHQQKDALVESIAGCVQDRKRELASDLRESQFESERLSLQLLQLARKCETDRQLLEMFTHSPDWIRQRANHTFCDLMKLVPAVYASFRLEGESVIGVTHSIDIEHENHDYHFDPYEIEVNLRTGKVQISGGTNVNDYVHPHVSSDSVCWGNAGHLVQRLAGELDLFGLFQLIVQFLTSVNNGDAFQRIERWNPDWEEESDEDDESWCEFCQDYGHSIGDCEECVWCDACSNYVEYDHNCPLEIKEEEEAADAVVEEQAS